MAVLRSERTVLLLSEQVTVLGSERAVLLSSEQVAVLRGEREVLLLSERVAVLRRDRASEQCCYRANEWLCCGASASERCCC